MSLLLAATLLASRPVRSHVEPMRFLYAIRHVENWDGLSEGIHGEIGPYQMKPPIFKQYGLLPIPENYEEAAKRHFVWCASRLKVRGKPVTVTTMAAIWHGGWTHYLEKRLTDADREYADRAVNVYFDRRIR